MTTTALLLMAAIVTPGVFLRGHAFHNHLVAQVALFFRVAGFAVTLECPRPLDNGQTDYIDILATRDTATLACEIETSPRNSGQVPTVSETGCGFTESAPASLSSSPPHPAEPFRSTRPGPSMGAK